MKEIATASITLPPRLSMDDYIDFIEDSIREANPVLAARQKSIEKQIPKPFSLSVASFPVLQQIPDLGE